MITAILKGLALGLMLSISVGPIIFAIIRQTVVNGHKGGLSFVAGVAVSDLTIVVICNVFSQLFNSAVSHEKTIGTVGSIFLLILGLFSIFFKKPIQEEDVRKVSSRLNNKTLVSSFFSGYFMNILNPGVFIFWFAASATLINNSKSMLHPNEYRLIAFATCLGFNIAFDVLKVFLSGKIRNRLTPHNINIINKISGAIFIIFGVILLYATLSGKTIGH